ncbi:MAG TPA: hypothetical protein VGL34_17550 [Steroidobacteraceae bacterium]|jgi:hypothetical protein
MNSGSGTTLPGTRIGHNRNSSPRRIKLLGLGEKGGMVARKVAKRGLPNVQVLTDAKPVGWKEIAATGAEAQTNMIVIVCAEGDERLFRPEHGKPDMLVTFVVLQRIGDPHAAGDQRVANVRGFSDLFVTTSDADYVSELIDNLAS